MPLAAGVTENRILYKEARLTFIMKVDLYNHQQRYKSWKDNVVKFGETDLTESNSKLLIQYVFDMEIGANVSIKSKKGARSYHRLNNVRQKLSKVFRMLQERKVNDISKVTENQVQTLFDDMQKGIIKTDAGQSYKSTIDYVKAFKAFWHWYMKINSRAGKIIPDITEYVDSKADDKPVWVYLNDDQIRTLLKSCSGKYAMLFEFLYDSGARVTETFSLKVSDVEIKGKAVQVNISKEISKSIGRNIKLLLCGENLKKYIVENDLKPDSPLFPISHMYANRYLSELCKQLFGDSISKGGEKYSNMTMYDWRHNSCCYWIQRYKTESSLMYRFGWMSSKYIHYYSEFLGMKDQIREEDLYVDITKTELENKIKELEAKIPKVDEIKAKMDKLTKAMAELQKEAIILKGK